MKNMSIKKLLGLLTCSAALVLSGCGGGGGVAAPVEPPTTITPTVPVANTYTIGGTVSGLAGVGLVLQNNGGDELQVSVGTSPIAITFPTAQTTGTQYSVTIPTQPLGQSCVVSNATGDVATANVTNIAVVCSNLPAAATYTIGASVSGLTASGLVLQNYGGNNLAVLPNATTAIFSTPLANLAPYAVTVFTQPAGQTCTVGNPSGNVAMADVTNVTVTCVANPVGTYDVGVTVSGSGASPVIHITKIVTNANISPIFGTNQANGYYNYNTGFAPGIRYVVRAVAPTNEVCKVINGVGVIVASNVTNVKVVCTQNAAHTVYTGNASSNISQFAIGNTGVLTPLSPALVSPTVGIIFLTVDSTGQFAYGITGSFGNTISQYAILPNGNLSATGTPVALLQAASGFFMHPSGQWVYASNQFGDILKFDRNLTTGQIAAVSTDNISNVSASGQGFIEPTGRFAYIFRDLNVDQYSINLTDGAMSFVSTMANVATPAGLAFDPSGRFAYLTISPMVGTATTLAYSIQANGALNLINGAPTATYPANVLAQSVAVDPSGKYVYVSVGTNIYQYGIQSSGTLISMSTSSINANINLDQIHIDASGKYLYTLAGNNNLIAHFAINAVDGSLAPIATGAGPYNLITNAVLTGGTYASSMSGR